MYTVILELECDSKKRLFGLCESCYWTASILRAVEHYKCPVCRGPEIALIPISQNEKYEYDRNTKHGFQIRFSVVEKPR